MELFGTIKKLIEKTKNGEDEVIKVFEVISFQCNLVDNQYQQKSDVLDTFTSNKSYDQLLNIEASNLVFLKLIILSLMKCQNIFRSKW